MAITTAVDADQFLSIAKLRALRQGLARLAEVCGAPLAARQIPILAATSWRMMSVRDPWVNLLRTTIATAAAGMGGADAVTVLPFTYALGPPDAFARRIARNTHIVLQEESALGRVQDPAGGSWYVEALTTDLAAASWAAFQAIETAGGIGATLIAGTVQKQLAVATTERRTAVARGKIELTGTTAFPKLGPDGVDVQPWPPATEQPDLPGERVTPLRFERLAEPFERLRSSADAATAAGHPPRVFLVTLGPAAVHGPRAQFMRNLLAAGGIEAVGETALLTSTEAGHAFSQSGCHVACLASSDAVYAELGEATVALLKTAGASAVHIAGRQTEALTQSLKAAGADETISVGTDRVALLTNLMRQLGIGP